MCFYKTYFPRDYFHYLFNIPQIKTAKSFGQFRISLLFTYIFSAHNPIILEGCIITHGLMMCKLFLCDTFQPRLVPIAVVQIMVGIAMGPSVFGRVAPEFYHMFANPASLSALSGVSTIAVLLFGLTIGLHLGPDLFRDKGRSFSLVVTARIATPMCWVFRAGSGSWFVILRNSPLE